MKLHSTNYNNTFIIIADDCPAMMGEIPPFRGMERSIAYMQFEIISKNPYKFTSDDVLFMVHAERKGIVANEWGKMRNIFYSKGQPCFRTSPLAKRYGWGIHHDKDGKMAIYGCESPEYAKLSDCPEIKVVKAMKSGK